MALHQIARDTFHYLWNNSYKPVLKVEPGDSVRFEINEVSSWQINKDAKLEDLVNLDPNKWYPLSGPIFVEGAEPGDALEIEVEEVKPEDWGWTCIVPGLGLLPEFKEPFLWLWDLSKKYDDEFVDFKNGIKVRLNPFCGVLGVAPKEKGSFAVMPPGRHGGNLDIKHLTVGSKLRLPVWTQGALFSTGDLHAAMGDGEVCVSAIECPGVARFKFNLIKDAQLSSPVFFTAKKKNRLETNQRARKAGAQEDEAFFVTTGIASDLLEACRIATRNMIDYLAKEHSLTRNEAYVLCSVACDLKIHEVVDQPNWVVGLWVAKDTLGLA